MWQQTKDGHWIYIVDHLSLIENPLPYDKDKAKEITDTAHRVMNKMKELMKENKMEIICNGKRFSDIS